jgi:hypothetical protein
MLQTAHEPASATPARWSLVITLVLFVAASAVLVPLSALGDERMSVFDEPTHADWVWRIAHGDMVIRGATLAPEILEEWSCRQSVWGDFMYVPPCDTVPNDPAAYSAGGINYNHFHAPLYYAVTAAGAVTIGWVASVESFVNAARLMGVFWLAAAMAGVYAVARQLGAGQGAARAAGLLFGLLPLVLHTSSIVTNDAALGVVGAGVMWVALRSVRVGLPLVLLGGAGVVAGLTKVVTFPAAAAAVLVMVAVALVWRAPGAQRRRLILGAVALALGFTVAQAAWLGVQTLRAPDGDYLDPVPGDVVAEGFPAGVIFGVAFDTLPPTNDPVRRSIESPGVAVTTWHRVTDVVLLLVPVGLVATGAGAAVRLRRQVRAGRDDAMSDSDLSLDLSDDPSGHRSGHPSAPSLDGDLRWLGVPVGVSVVVGLIMGAVVLNLQHWMAKGSALSYIHPRYGLALAPVLVAGLAMLADRNRLTRWALWVAVGIGAVVMVGALVT